MVQVLFFLASVSFAAASTCTEKYSAPEFAKRCAECEKWYPGKEMDCMACGNLCYHSCKANKPACSEAGNEYSKCRGDCMIKKIQDATPPILAKAECAINNGNAISSLVEASTHLYQGIQTCTKAASVGTPRADHDEISLECVADMFELVSSVAEITRYALNVFGLCFEQGPPPIRCINVALTLTEEIAEIVASAADLKTPCWDHKTRVQGRVLKKASCVVDVQKATSFFIATLVSATTIKKKCDHSPTSCSAVILNGVGSLAGVAEYIIAAFGDCSSDIPMNTQCGRNVAKLIKGLAVVSANAPKVKAACSNITAYEPSKTTRVPFVLNDINSSWDTSLGKSPIGNMKIVSKSLGKLIGVTKYDTRDNIPQASTSTIAFPTNAALLAAVPVAFAIGFFGGRKTRADRVNMQEFGYLTALYESVNEQE